MILLATLAPLDTGALARFCWIVRLGINLFEPQCPHHGSIRGGNWPAMAANKLCSAHGKIMAYGKTIPDHYYTTLLNDRFQPV